MRPPLAAAGIAAVLALVGCTAAPAPRAGVAAHSGAYPVAAASAAPTTVPTVRPGGYALVAAGDPVDVHLPHADLRLTVAGPDVDVPTPPPGQPISGTSAPGVLTVTAVAVRGSTAISSAQFLGLDEDQDRFALRTDRRSGTASPGHPVTLHLRSRFATGHTTLSWRPAGRPLVTWDFTIEID
ncbi:hypothetical protein [Amnibacterium endophyticum]|uniref:Uncharacterized protein n=1 Tax=Amnibacterium endophyticum TaxID=2109337 RepID=A0ABW4LDC3_9MICO